LALAGAAIILLLATLLPPRLGTGGELVRAVGGTSAFTDSLGRATESFQARLGTWRKSASLLGSDLALGIGPSVTDETLELRSAPSDELHNDYIASFLERGFVGGLGLMMLVAMICVWTIRAARNRQLITEGWHPTALIGCTVSILLSAMTLETLHFRHIWLYLALIVALCLIEPKAARFTK
jgi:O-antigen ligase